MFAITRTGCTVFGITLRWYGVLIALAVLAAVTVCSARERRLGLPKGAGLDLALVCVPVGILCARAYYVAFNWQVYAANPLEALMVWKGGLAIYGGAIGGAVGAWIYAKVKKLPFGALADLVAPALALAQSVGRWGNFLNQEAYGIAVRNPSLQFFPIAVNISGEWRLATFFYESAWCACIAAMLLTAEKKRRFKRTGDAFLWYILLYAAERAVVEGLRTDSLMLGGLRVSQLLSLAALTVLLILLAVRAKKAGVTRLLPILALTAATVCLFAEKNGFAAVLMAVCLAFAAIVYERM